MARWIILLRGVNVSGKNKVPMAEWKAGLAALYRRFPIKMTPAGRNLRGCYFCGGFFLFCNAAGRFRRKGAQPPPESHRYMILPAATQSFPSFLQT